MSAHERHQDLIAYLITSGAKYRSLSHSACRTCEESASARAAEGELDAVGAKALVIKLLNDASFALLVMPGTKRLNNKAARKTLGPFRFANQEELQEVTQGLMPGSVPPFGWPYLAGINTVYLDPDILLTRKIGFNAAALDRSVVMTTEEYLRVLGKWEALEQIR